MLFNAVYEIQVDIKILEHYGGGSGLLYTELEELKHNSYGSN